MKVGDELDHAPESIEERDVVMVGHLLRDDELDLESLRRFGEAIHKRVVRFGVGSQQKLPLRSTTRQHVEGAGKHLAREAHARA